LVVFVSAISGGLQPVSREFGFDRGRPVDRHYIEAFLAERAGDIHGRVLEVGDGHLHTPLRRLACQPGGRPECRNP
jgi:hypothetical protein